MSRYEQERDRAYQVAQEHRAKADEYKHRDGRCYRDHTDKAHAWEVYAEILADLPL